MAIVILTILLVVLPVIVGVFLEAEEIKGLRLFVRLWAKGWALMLAVFEMVYIPAYFLKISYHKFLMVYCVIIPVLCIAAILYRHRLLLCIFQVDKERAKKLPVLLFVCVVLAILATYVPAFYTHGDEDDAYYIATAVTTQTTDSMFRYNPYTGYALKNPNSRYLLSPMPVYFAMLSTLSGMHVLSLAHRVFPIYCILLAFAIGWILGQVLYADERRKQEWFLLFYIVLTVLSGYSVRNSSTFLMYRIWQGKAVLAAVLLPLIWAVCLEWLCVEDMGQERNADNEKTDRGRNRIQLMTLFVLSAASGLVSSMGIFLAPVLIGALSLAGALYRRKLTCLWQGILCCLPCIMLGMIYIVVF